MRLLLVLLSLTIATNAAASCDQDLKDPNSAVQVVDASVTTTKSDGSLFVTVIGELRNTTNEKINDLVIEAKLTNSSGIVIDVISEPVYGLVVPAGQQVAFRLQTTAAADQGSYSGVKAPLPLNMNPDLLLQLFEGEKPLVDLQEPPTHIRAHLLHQ